jgi:hypothetical protein
MLKISKIISSESKKYCEKKKKLIFRNIPCVGVKISKLINYLT